MCGIVGAVARRDVGPLLIEGLKRLEYRGYDSAGLVLLQPDGRFERLRTVGKVALLEQAWRTRGLAGSCGLAHTRWATHGAPSERNAHPHVCADRVAVVHNGIIENHDALREALAAEGRAFESDTDSELIAHLIDRELARQGGDLVAAVRRAAAELEGAFAIGVIARGQAGRIVAYRRGSPLLLGLGEGENFLGSDVQAFLPFTRRYLVLEDDDCALIQTDRVEIFDAAGRPVERPERRSALDPASVGRAGHRHFMHKEIHEQPEAVAATLEGRLGEGAVAPGIFGPDEARIFDQVEAVHIVACGTSHHAAAVARYWIEKFADLPCTAEIASEFRYRRVVVRPKTLLVAVSQSGETADTLAALRYGKSRGFFASLAICNVPESALVRECDLTLLTRAGPEIGVASTKAFTTQLVALFLLALRLVQGRRADAAALVAREIDALRSLPVLLGRVLELEARIEALAAEFADKAHTLFLGRGTMYPVALEGALKLKEISYIHAEGYPAGELKHGPLALVNEDMPVVVVAPYNDLLDKIKSNLQEVRARAGRAYVFADGAFGMRPDDGLRLVELPHCPTELAPIVYSVPLQLLAYHVAVLKGTDVDQPRNLAKSVTVE